MNISHSILLIAVAAAVTFALRAAPFALFGGARKMPPIIKNVADRLPAAIMAVLVVYCLKGDLTAPGLNTLSGILAVLAVVLVHLWRRNTLLSVFAGTAVYMLCLRLLPLLG